MSRVICHLSKKKKKWNKFVELVCGGSVINELTPLVYTIINFKMAPFRWIKMGMVPYHYQNTLVYLRNMALLWTKQKLPGDNNLGNENEIRKHCQYSRVIRLAGDDGTLTKRSFIKILKSSDFFMKAFNKNKDGIVTEVKVSVIWSLNKMGHSC